MIGVNSFLHGRDFTGFDGEIPDLCHLLCWGAYSGLEATSGITVELFIQRSDSNRWRNIAVVPGAIVDRQGRVGLGNRDPQNGKRALIDIDLKNGKRYGSSPQKSDNGGPTENTTLTLGVTNLKLGYSELQRPAISTHTSMARVKQPFHTPHDGDTLFAVTTHEVANANMRCINLATYGSDLAWDAVLSCVPRED